MTGSKIRTFSSFSKGMIVDDNESTRREENEIIKEIYLKEKIKRKNYVLQIRLISD